jgi:dTDP-glucose pyrophosphorylase
MKGVILAGGSGTRLHPLTRITNKHLLPLYDRPMVTYAVEALVRRHRRADARHRRAVRGRVLPLLGNGHDYGIDRLLYAYQEEAGGIADALGLAERFVDRERSA